jgi:hypothetical protein
MAGTNAAEIERIVDRKLIKSRVHYLVVWRGFGEENNTWCVRRAEREEKERGRATCSPCGG